MKIHDAKTGDLLPHWASGVDFAADAFDGLLHYAGGRSACLPAPLTLESAQVLDDDEQQAYFNQFGLAKYYPDVSSDKRAWMLYQQNRLWRWLGTPYAMEILCQYLFDETTVHLKVMDNLAFDADGHLIDSDLYDVFDAELTIDDAWLPSWMLRRIQANVFRFVRNSQYLRAFSFLFESLDEHVDVSVSDGNAFATDYEMDLSADDTLPIPLDITTTNNGQSYATDYEMNFSASLI